MFSGSPVHDSLGIFVLKEELDLETDSQAFMTDGVRMVLQNVTDPAVTLMVRESKKEGMLVYV